MASYESHAFLQDDFPLIYHKDQLGAGRIRMLPHWQDNIELLCFTQGTGTVQVDAEFFRVGTGDLVIVNPNQMHMIWAEDASCEYDCLIVSTAYLESLGLPMGKLFFDRRVDAAPWLPVFARLSAERSGESPYFKALCKALCAQLMIDLARTHAREGRHRPPERMEHIKKGVTFLQENFREAICVEEVCSAAGLSKYYFCRLFREYTGLSVIQYLNRLRCQEARRLLYSGLYSVSQCAQMAGFNNLSYFTRTYRKQMGCLPSREMDE